MIDKELRNAALQLATMHLQNRFEHLAKALAGNEEAYVELAANHYPSTEEVIAEAEKYMKFVDGTA